MPHDTPDLLVARGKVPRPRARLDLVLESNQQVSNQFGSRASSVSDYCLLTMSGLARPNGQTRSLLAKTPPILVEPAVFLFPVLVRFLKILL